MKGITMRATRALKKPSVTIVLSGDYISSGGHVYVHFNQRLNHRGTDFKVYANTGYETHELDSVLLCNILAALLTDDSAVADINVKAFELEIMANKTTTGSEIMERIFSGADAAGYVVSGSPVSVRS